MQASTVGPVRSCVGCRQRHPASALIRLQVDATGCLVPAEAEGRRSAWVCPRRSCVDRIQRNPKGLYRALRQSPPPCTHDLLERVRAEVDAQLRLTLQRCHRQGMLCTGRHAVLHSTNLVAIFAAADASAVSLESLLLAHPGIPIQHLPWNRGELGALLGCGMRAFVGLHPGRCGDLFRQGLQRRAHLS